MSQTGKSAADICNDEDEADIASIIFLYGEERAQSRRIAKAIVAARPSNHDLATRRASLQVACHGPNPGNRTLRPALSRRCASRSTMNTVNWQWV